MGGVTEVYNRESAPARNCRQNRLDGAVTSASRPIGTAGNQGRNIGENARQTQAAWRRQVFRLPLGGEFFLVLPQSLEVVEVLAVAKNERPHPIPQRSKRPDVQAR